MVEPMFCHRRCVWPCALLFWSPQIDQSVRCTPDRTRRLCCKPAESSVPRRPLPDEGNCVSAWAAGQDIQCYVWPVFCGAGRITSGHCGRKAIEVYYSFGRSLHDYIVVKKLFHRQRGRIQLHFERLTAQWNCSYDKVAQITLNGHTFQYGSRWKV